MGSCNNNNYCPIKIVPRGHLFNKTFTSVAIVFRLQNIGYSWKSFIKLTPDMQVLTPLRGCFILTMKYFEVHFFNFRMILYIAKMTQILFQSSLELILTSPWQLTPLE